MKLQAESVDRGSIGGNFGAACVGTVSTGRRS